MISILKILNHKQNITLKGFLQNKTSWMWQPQTFFHCMLVNTLSKLNVYGDYSDRKFKCIDF